MSACTMQEGFEAADQIAALGQAVIATDLEGVVVAWNPAAESMYGWTAAEAVGRNIATLSVPEIAQDVAADIMDALRRGVPWTGEFPVRRKDGSIFPALVTDSGVFHDGELVGIVGVSTNLGVALRPLLERSTDAALVMRTDAVVTYASPAVQQLFGWGLESVMGTSISTLLHPEDQSVLAGVLTGMAAEPGAHPPVELRVRSRGSWAWVEAALTNLLDDPLVRGVVCNLRFSANRSAREQAEVKATQLQTALQSRVVIEQAKGYLVGRDGISLEEAFERLRAHARGHNVSIHDVSRDVVAGRLSVDRSG